jgi:tRNA C32,U32 (ribose-2'-O)-methylase TrmJ
MLLPSHAPSPHAPASASASSSSPSPSSPTGSYFELPRVPGRLAIVMGTESTGVSPELLAAADRRIYLPMRGFADSLNLSVAAALVLQKVLSAMNDARNDTAMRSRGNRSSTVVNEGQDTGAAASAAAATYASGDATPAQRLALRMEWYPLLARSAEERARFLARIDTGDIPTPFKVRRVG